jgi:hypothetical protein
VHEIPTTKEPEAALRDLEARVAETLQRIADLQRFIFTLERVQMNPAGAQKLLLSLEHQLSSDLLRQRELKRSLVAAA